MRTFCYSITDTFGKKMIGGTVTSTNMEDAANKIILRHRIKAIEILRSAYLGPAYEFLMNDKKVYVHLSLDAETFYRSFPHSKGDKHA